MASLGSILWLSMIPAIWEARDIRWQMACAAPVGCPHVGMPMGEAMLSFLILIISPFVFCVIYSIYSRPGDGGWRWFMAKIRRRSTWGLRDLFPWLWMGFIVFFATSFAWAAPYWSWLHLYIVAVVAWAIFTIVYNRPARLRGYASENTGTDTISLGQG